MESDAWPRLILIAAPVGLAAAWIMNRLMWAVSRQRDVPVNMTEALGSLILRREEGANALGTAVHLLSGALFAIGYLAIIAQIGLTAPGESLLLGLGFGLIHGVVVTFGLMIVVDEMHPVEKYRKATLSIGIVHLAGHIMFGGLVGLIGGFAL